MLRVFNTRVSYFNSSVNTLRVFNQCPIKMSYTKVFRMFSDDSSSRSQAPPSKDTPHTRIKTPSQVLALPLFKRPIFPGIVAPIVVPNEPFAATLQAIRDQMPVNVGLFLAKTDSVQPTTFNSLDQVHNIGLLAQVIRVFPHKQGMSQVVLVGLHRIQATASVTPSSSSSSSDDDDNKTTAQQPLMVKVKPIKDEAYDAEDPQIKAYTLEMVATIKSLLKLGPMFKDQYTTIIEQVDLSRPGDLSDCVAGLTSAEPAVTQRVLEMLNITSRLKLALELVKREVEYGHIQAKINSSLDGTTNRNHRRFVLLEQLKKIKKELGMEHDERDSLITKFNNRIASRTIPDAVMTTINEELSKLSNVEPTSSEFNVTRNYLDWLTILPWGTSSSESFEIDKAENILNKDHFGLDEVKQRILELIAVGSLKGVVSGKILCLVGPPGVGKTSIGKSIARALSREFYRFSVGGMTDVAEIKGHRRTYVGALPGKPIQALKITKTSNPVLLIDEIDKMGRGINGDPASSLLEVLDPEQNGSFLDHYLDVPFDVSKVLFIVTANSLQTIPRPLLDRMETLEVTGYVTDEKIAIATKYLIPRALRDCGLEAKNVVIEEEAIRDLVSGYCREAGVRNLQQQLEKILRKVSLRIATGNKQDKDESINITSSNLSSYVGKPVFTNDRYHKNTPPGVVMGLAYSQMGGSAMYIEAISTPSEKGTPQFKTTGSMGDVMTESTNIALTFAKAQLIMLQPDNDFFRTSNVHMHVPQGATPKEGPSAGCAMVTCLLSLATGKPVPSKLAMTGEITLTGKVLRIGGVKEKTMAAKRAEATTLIFPKDNEADFSELPDYIKSGMQAHFVTDFSDVLKIVLPDAGLQGPQIAPDAFTKSLPGQ